MFVAIRDYHSDNYVLTMNYCNHDAAVIRVGRVSLNFGQDRFLSSHVQLILCACCLARIPALVSYCVNANKRRS